MTWRAVLVGVLGVLLISIGTPYSDLVMRGTWVGLTAFPISSFFLLVVGVTAFNVPLRRLGWGLTTQELLGAYAMTLVAAGIPSFGLTGLLVPYLAGPTYFAKPENHYSDTILRFLPRGLLVRDLDAARALYEGLPPGSPLPWETWGRVLAIWAFLIAGMYFLFFGMSALLRKPWVEDEKLVFPLVHLPVELATGGPERTAWPPFLRDPVVWGFFAGPFCLHAINGLHYYLPAVPRINVHLIDLGQYFGGRVGEAIKPFWLRMFFSIVGLTYLLPSDVSFSLWFFYFFFLVQQMLGAWRGHVMPFVQAYPVRQFVAHQMIGGILLFGLYLLWNARAHFRQTAQQALRFREGESQGKRERGRAGEGRLEIALEEQEEPLSPRTAYTALLLGTFLVLAWGNSAGAGLGWTALLLGLFGVVHLVAARLVCEGGMLYVQHPFRPLNILLAGVGAAGLGRPAIPSLVLLDHLWMLDNRSPLMPTLLQAFKIGDQVGLRQRRLTAALALSVTIAVPVSLGAYLVLMYRHGGLSLNPWFTTYYTHNLYGTWTAYLMTQGEPSTPTTFLTMLLGGATMGALVLLHRLFWWWPLHPVGYLMGASWPMINFWFPIFLGWLIKALVLRYGGAKIYRRLISGFLALILAEFFAAGLWVLIDYGTGVTGHEIFSF